METTAERTSRWDARVVNENGDPVPQYRPPWSRGWWTITRAAGPDGVRLATRIPGYPAGTTEHDDQAAAEAAAQRAWLRYAADVTAATGKDEETAPWETS